MENGVVDHLWLALRKSKHEIANGEWRLALEKTQYQKKQDSLADSPTNTCRARTFPYGALRSPLILEVLWVGRIGEVRFSATRASHLAPASKEPSTGMHSVASAYG